MTDTYDYLKHYLERAPAHTIDLLSRKINTAQLSTDMTHEWFNRERIYHLTPAQRLLYSMAAVEMTIPAMEDAAHTHPFFQKMPAVTRSLITSIRSYLNGTDTHTNVHLKASDITLGIGIYRDRHQNQQPLIPFAPAYHFAQRLEHNAVDLDIDYTTTGNVIHHAHNMMGEDFMPHWWAYCQVLYPVADVMNAELDFRVNK